MLNDIFNSFEKLFSEVDEEKPMAVRLRPLPSTREADNQSRLEAWEKRKAERQEKITDGS